MSHKCKVLHLFLGKNRKGIEINVFQVKVLDAITWNNLSSFGFHLILILIFITKRKSSDGTMYSRISAQKSTPQPTKN